MKIQRQIKASNEINKPSTILLNALKDGRIGVYDVVMEFIKYCSEADVADINDTLGLIDDDID